jgi:hypothetical protein
MYTVTLNELKAVLKVSAQAGESGVVNKTSVKSMAQDDDVHKVKRRKKRISTSQTAKKSTKSVPISTAVKPPPKVVSTLNIFAPLRTTGMDTETTGAENALPKQEAPRNLCRLPPRMMTSTTSFFRIQSDLKDHVKGQYEFRNTRNGTSIITKEMVDYSAMKSYMEKNNLHHFTFSSNSEKPIKAVISHLPPDMLAEEISNSLEDLGFNVRQITATRTALNGQTHVEPPSIPCYLNEKHKISKRYSS